LESIIDATRQLLVCEPRTDLDEVVGAALLVAEIVAVERDVDEGVAVKGKHDELDDAPSSDVVPEGQTMGYSVFKGQ